MTEHRVVLPTNVKPDRYRLTLEPDLEKFVFKGSAEIDITITGDTDKIIVNALELEIQSAIVEQSGNTSNSTISYDIQNEYAIFQLAQKITEGSAVLKLEFTGELNDKLVGFYRSKYELNGETRYMATTQFAPTDARKAFPCWDEPAVKSVFELSLITPKDRIALSNMNVLSTQELDNNRKMTTFAQSPIMSTYLLAFIVGDFDYIEQKASNGVDIRVYVPVGKKEQGTFGLDVAVKSLPLLEDYFGQKYPLPKLDLVAIADFAFGAMENWGLVTYRETALLVDPVNSAATSKQRIALTVAHEISHQWFGNLVTMDWWQDLWLNEGFATWIQYFVVEKLYPDWNIFEQFVNDDFGRAMSLDQLESSHPIEVPIRAAAEVNEIFDAISYSKGCAVIRMLVEYLTVGTFRKGLLIYLERHKYANASTKDLWNALSEASGKDISSMMTSWTRQTGYPVLVVTQTDKRKLKITQNRYLSNGIDYNDETIWHIPIAYVTNHGRSEAILMAQKSIEIEVEEFEWIKLNPQQTGFYRVSYPAEYYASVTHAVKSKLLSPIDRLGIEEDVVSLACAGVVSTSLALTVLNAYVDEDNYTVLKGVCSSLNLLLDLAKREPFCDEFTLWARSLLDKHRELGWVPQSGETHITSMLRALVISNLARFDDPEMMQTSLDKFDEFLQNNDTVVPDLRTTLYAVNIRYSKKAYVKVKEIYNTTQLNEEKLRCLRSLGAVHDDNYLKKTLESSINGEVRSQDAMLVIMGVADNPRGALMAWEFFKDNYETIKQKYDGSVLFGRMIKVATQGLVYQSEEQDVKQFLESRETPATKRSIAQALEMIKLNARWLERSKGEIEEWLRNNS